MIFVVTACIAVPIISVFLCFCFCFCYIFIFSFSFAITIFFFLATPLHFEYIFHLFLISSNIQKNHIQSEFYSLFSIHVCASKRHGVPSYNEHMRFVIFLYSAFLSEQITQSRSFRPSSFFTLTCGFTLLQAFLFVK
jgi:hypothetical protein